MDREFANEKESGRYDIISECKNSQRFLENIKNELKNKEEKIKKEECSKWDKIHEDKKPLHKECFFVQMELKEEYCSECRHRERKFIRGRSVFLYNAQMKNSLLRYKYYGSREYGKYYAESMCRYVGRDIKSWRPDVIIPVPLHRRKKRMRGFNQAADLAERIGKILGIPVAEDVIYKSRETRSQKKLDAEERKEKSQKCVSGSRAGNRPENSCGR